MRNVFRFHPEPQFNEMKVLFCSLADYTLITKHLLYLLFQVFLSLILRVVTPIVSSFRVTGLLKIEFT